MNNDLTFFLFNLKMEHCSNGQCAHVFIYNSQLVFQMENKMIVGNRCSFAAFLVFKPWQLVLVAFSSGGGPKWRLH